MTERTPGRPSNAVSSHQKHPPAKIAVARSPGGRALDARDAASQSTTPAATRNFKTSLLLRFETTPPRHIRFQNRYGGFTPGGSCVILSEAKDLLSAGGADPSSLRSSG